MADDRDEVIIVPCGLFESSSKGCFRVVDGADEVESEPVKDGEVGWGVVLSATQCVLGEYDIERPVEAIFDIPVCPGDGEGTRRIEGPGQQVESLGRRVVVALAGEARDGVPPFAPAS